MFVRVTIVTHAFVRVCACIANALVALTDDCVRAVPLRTTWCGLIFAVFIHLTLLVAVEEVGADIVDTATRHTFKSEGTHIHMLLFTMKTD